MPPVGGGQIQDGSKPGGNSSEILHKTCSLPRPTPTKEELTASNLSYIFGILQGNKSKRMLYGWKRTTFFFQFNTHCAWQNVLRFCKYLKGMFPGPRPLCFVYQSDAFSKCVQIIKTRSLCIGIPQSPEHYYRNVFLPFLTFKTMPSSLQVKNLSCLWIH